MANIELSVALQLLRSASDPNAETVIEAAIEELERLELLEDAAVELSRLVLEDPPTINDGLAERILALAGQSKSEDFVPA